MKIKQNQFEGVIINIFYAFSDYVTALGKTTVESVEGYMILFEEEIGEGKLP
jgi:hypothetical protein